MLSCIFKMKFEEEFPSLKECVPLQQDEYSNRFYSEHKIMEHCLDKKRVRTIISNHLRPIPGTDKVIVTGLQFSLMLQQLGLDE